MTTSKHLTPEQQIVMIKDVNGEPALVFTGTSKTEVSIKLEHLADLVEDRAPALSLSLRNAVSRWKVLKQTGNG